MELRRASEALLRAQPRLGQCLAASSVPRAHFIHHTHLVRRQCFQGLVPRSFHTSRFRLASDDGRSKPKDDLFDHSYLDGLLDSTLDGTKGSPAAPASRRSHYKSPEMQEANRRGPDFGFDTEDTLLDGGRPERNNTPAKNSLSTSYDDLLREFGSLAPAISSMGIPSIRNELPPSLPYRLGPRVGRTIRVSPENGFDVGKAFSALNRLLVKNSVKSDFRRQQAHERPGLKRKRVKIERWRKHFKEGFRGVIALVHKMKKQGW